ncbi:MAG: hypothetical protein SWY16_05305 [Cyanobacteriota bacterium]|nr:hypothetical protein [Cyanobacteriota bacterium]
MVLIRDIVRQTLASGYLSLTEEEQLRQLLTSKYDVEDFQAFIHLQRAALEGQVKQESRELREGETARNC